MNRIYITALKVCCLSLILFNPHVFAQTASNQNICAQTQCVKIQNGGLWVLSSDNGTYAPYFIKGVDYEPTPIGRYPSDWGYAQSDPRFINNNIFDDPNILIRDFTLLQKMNANTIRVWSGNNTSVNGRFLDYITNAGTTANADTSQNTLDIAQGYGLKVIAGFGVGTLTFDANNNIGAINTGGTTDSRQTIINNFVNYVNTFKGNRALLFWAIGNENNLQAGLTSPQKTAWYNLVDAMALAAHTAEGANFHPVAVVNGEVAEIGDSASGATDAQLPDLDIWGANVYYGKTFGSLFSNFTAQSSKPLWISEFGIDAWNVTDPTGINNWGPTPDDDLGGIGSYDPVDQSTWDGNLWNEILSNAPVTIGGSVMEYSDEYWKPNEFYCTSPTATADENVITAAICNSNQKYFGFPESGNVSPDDFFNEEWWGIMAISSNPVAGQPDIMTPRPVYANLQGEWLANPWSTLTLNMNGSGIGTVSSSASLGAGFNCNFSAGSSAGHCAADFIKNQPVTLSFSSTNNSTITNWGVNGCSGNTCTITPDTDITLNVTMTSPSIAPSGPTVSLISPVNNASYIQSGSIVLSAQASSPNGIAYVIYYNGTTEIGSTLSNISPYTVTWKFTNAGTYTVTAVATDNAGLSTTSAPVTVTVTAPASPVVTITSPAYGTYVVGDLSDLTITATASSTQGTIKSVTFYANNVDGRTTLLGTDNRSPYTYKWKNVPVGTYYLTAVAVDSTGASATSASIFLSAGATTFGGSLTTDNTMYTAPATVVLTLSHLTVNDRLTDSISKVAFYNGTKLLGRVSSPASGVAGSPYIFTWKNVPGGTYNLTAVATDSRGIAGTFYTAPITVNPKALIKHVRE